MIARNMALLYEILRQLNENFSSGKDNEHIIRV